MKAPTTIALSEPIAFANAKWRETPDGPGVHVMADRQEIVCVGMAGRECISKRRTFPVKTTENAAEAGILENWLLAEPMPALNP